MSMARNRRMDFLSVVGARGDLGAAFVHIRHNVAEVVVAREVILPADGHRNQSADAAGALERS